MGITKNVTLGILTQNWMAIAFILYGSQMLIFRQGLELTSMTILNLIWNLFSSIVITLIGLYYFNEKLSNLEIYGILFAFIAIFFLY
jgi:multidrug transporter EmrE-like cation transporter